MRRKRFILGALALACVPAFAAAQTISSLPLKGADSSTYQEAGYSDGTHFFPAHLEYGWTGSAAKAWTVDTNGYGGVNVFSSALPAGAATQATLSAIQTALGSPLQAGGHVNVDSAVLATGAATAAGQASQLTATQALLQPGGKVDTVISGTATDRGASVTSATAVQLMAANASRRGFSVQNQFTSACYINGTATATADYHSLQIPAGSLYETSPQHTGTGAISIICPSATSGSPASIYSREF